MVRIISNNIIIIRVQENRNNQKSKTKKLKNRRKSSPQEHECVEKELWVSFTQ